MSRKGKVFGFILPLAAVVGLILLLVFALTRLAQIQHDMRDNVNANMLWVITQTQVKALRFESALQEQLRDGDPDDSLVHAWRLLSSRFNLLSAGPQKRYLDAIAAAPALLESIEQTRQAADEYLSPGSTPAQASRLLAVLDVLDDRLAMTANRTMVAQWEALGSRLDHYRNRVLTIIFLMLGICVCSFIISVYLFVALRRVRESEWAKRQALQLQSQLDAERQVSDLHRNFAAMVSHQFRTPLAIIDSSMQRILRAGDRVSSDELRHRVQKVRRATARLARLVEHTRIADQYADLLEVHLEACEIMPLVESMVQQQREITPRRTIHIVAPLSGELPRACCDPMLAEHIIFNFLTNAVKYSPDGSDIHVTLYHDGEWVGCAVKDRGIGIRDADRPYLFDRYYRGQGVADTPGTGIGLYVVDKLARMQGAMVEVAPNPEGGTVFTVRFRRASPQLVVELEGKDAATGGT